MGFKFEMKGMDKLQKKLAGIAKRAAAVDGLGVEGVTAEEAEKIGQDVREHIVTGKPLKLPKKR